MIGLGTSRRVGLALLTCAFAAIMCSAECVREPRSDRPAKLRKEPITIPVRLLLAHAETRVTPSFPKEAYEARVDGSVIMALEVNHDGAVTEIRPLSGLPVLQLAAREALAQWRFESFCIHGVPYTVRSAVEFQFRWRGASRIVPQ